MYADKTVGVVVPAYNEAGYVGDVLDAIPGFVDRIYVVDDASTDGTWEEITEHTQAHNAAYPSAVPNYNVKVIPIRHEENRGAGGALKTGYRLAVSDRIEVTATIDGDGQMDPEEIGRYLDPIVAGHADYAKGNRFMVREDWAAMPPFRLAGNLLLSYLTKVASGYWQTMDPQNGYTAISLEALERIDLEEMYEYYGYCNDLLVKLNVEGLRVADVRCVSNYDGEKSHIEYRKYVPRVSSMLLKNFFWRLKTKYLLGDFHLLALFYVVGMGLTGVGIAGLLTSLAGSFEYHVAWLILLLAGIVLFLLGAAIEMGVNRGLERRFTDEEFEGERSATARELA